MFKYSLAKISMSIYVEMINGNWLKKYGKKSIIYCAKVKLEPMISRLWITVGVFVAEQYVILETKNTSFYTVKLQYILLCSYTSDSATNLFDSRCNLAYI